MENLMVTRFNHNTWKQLIEYKKREKIKTIVYACPRRIKETVPINSNIFVLEMNNDSNRIMGVSLIKNYVMMDKYYNIYKDGNYNRFVYKGTMRIDRSHLNEKEEIVMKILDIIVFKGKGHVKRGQGIMDLPKEKYSKIKIDDLNLYQCVKLMFTSRKHFDPDRKD
jgi:hypothetical protein